MGYGVNFGGSSQHGDASLTLYGPDGAAVPPSPYHQATLAPGDYYLQATVTVVNGGPAPPPGSPPPTAAYFSGGVLDDAQEYGPPGPGGSRTIVYGSEAGTLWPLPLGLAALGAAPGVYGSAVRMSARARW